MRKIKPMKMGMDMVEPSKPMYPHFSIETEHLPEAKKWEIGKTYYVTLELKQKDMMLHKEGDKEMGHVGFDVTGIEVVKKPKENLSLIHI